jgi:AraC-like DNA-binding protein
MVIHIHSDLMHPCRIEEICKRFGINKNKLQHIFRIYSGVSYHDCVSNARRERAQYYLAFTEIPLSEIAYRLGFTSEQHFYRFFRREAGISPLEFRRTAVAQRKEAFAAACFGRPALLDPVDPGTYPSHS